MRHVVASHSQLSLSTKRSLNAPKCISVLAYRHQNVSVIARIAPAAFCPAIQCQICWDMLPLVAHHANSTLVSHITALRGFHCWNTKCCRLHILSCVINFIYCSLTSMLVTPFSHRNTYLKRDTAVSRDNLPLDVILTKRSEKDSSTKT